MYLQGIMEDEITVNYKQRTKNWPHESVSRKDVAQLFPTFSGDKLGGLRNNFFMLCVYVATWAQGANAWCKIRLNLCKKMGAERKIQA
jgi:hypothetical protein